MPAPFLTLVHPELAVKGSRDPLGLQPMWTHFGRALVGNLTTITTSVRGFTTLMLGYHYAARMVAEHRLPEDEVISLFMKVEQLVAYSRIARAPGEADVAEGYETIRGVLTARRRLNENGGKVLISASRSGQILSNQKAYGLWGLYSVAGRNSGLLQEKRVGTTALAEEFLAHQILPQLRHSADARDDKIAPFLQRDEVFDPNGKDKTLADGLASIHTRTFDHNERTFYTGQLLHGGASATTTPQRRLWALMEEVNDDPDESGTNWEDGFGMRELRVLIKRALRQDENEVHERLLLVRRLEDIIAPSARLFAFLQTKSGRTVEDVADEVSQHWGRPFEQIEPGELTGVLREVTLAAGGAMALRVQNTAQCLHAGEYRRTIHLLLEQNLDVMERRGGGPWITVKGGKLDVRYKDEAAGLPSPDELNDLWVNSYFLGALKAIGATLRKPNGAAP